MSGSARAAAAAEVHAQAKVNLRLRILAREEGGYHQLETLFLRLALADTVRVRRTAGERSLDVGGLPADATLGPVERNLAWRAAEAYAAASEWRGGFALELDKRIPVGGGLGGGSADAGAVLRAMEAISDAPLGESALLGLAGTLGADVPFLASEHAYALAWGRGERMLALRAPTPRPLLLVVPPFGVNTAEAYGWLAVERAGRDTASHAEPALDPALLSEWPTISALAINHFEPVVAARHPEIDGIVMLLREMGCDPAMMSGSGSTVFGVLPEREGGHAVLASSPGLQVITTVTVDRVEPVRLLD